MHTHSHRETHPGNAHGVPHTHMARVRHGRLSDALMTGLYLAAGEWRHTGYPLMAAGAGNNKRAVATTVVVNIAVVVTTD